MIVAKKNFLLRIILDLSVLLISAGVRRSVSYDSSTSKRLELDSRWLRNGSNIKLGLRTGLYCKRLRIVALGSDLRCRVELGLLQKSNPGLIKLGRIQLASDYGSRAT